MTCDRQRPERAEESAVMERNQTERNNDKKDCLLVNVPTKEEGGISTKRDRTNESLPRWFVEHSEQYGLHKISTNRPKHGEYVQFVHPVSGESRSEAPHQVEQRKTCLQPIPG